MDKIAFLQPHRDFLGHSFLVFVAIVKKVSIDKTLKLGARNVALGSLNQYEILKMQTIWENRPNALKMTQSPG